MTPDETRREAERLTAMQRANVLSAELSRALDDDNDRVIVRKARVNCDR